MISFSRTLAEEIGPRKVYNVFPGATATRMTGFHGDPPEKVAESIVLLPGVNTLCRTGEMSR